MGGGIKTNYKEKEWIKKIITAEKRNYKRSPAISHSDYVTSRKLCSKKVGTVR